MKAGRLKAVASTHKYGRMNFGAARPNANSASSLIHLLQTTDSWVRDFSKRQNRRTLSFRFGGYQGKFTMGNIKHTLLAGLDADRPARITIYLITPASAATKNIYDTINILGTKQYQQRVRISRILPWTFYTAAFKPHGCLCTGLLWNAWKLGNYWRASATACLKPVQRQHLCKRQ